MNAIAKVNAKPANAHKVTPLSDVELRQHAAQSTKARSDWQHVMQHKLKGGHTVADTIPHMVAQYDKAQLLQTEVLSLYRAIGQKLHEIRAVIGKSDKLFGGFIASTPLADISRQDRADCMWLAENWAQVQKANDKGQLDQLSVSRIRQLVKTDTKPRQTVAKDDAPKGKVTDGNPDTKPQVDAKADTPVIETPKAAPVAKTPAELAAETLVQLDAYGITVAEFAAALMALVKARKG